MIIPVKIQGSSGINQTSSGIETCDRFLSDHAAGFRINQTSSGIETRAQRLDLLSVIQYKSDQ